MYPLGKVRSLERKRPKCLAADSFISAALSIAREIQLENLDKTPTAELQNTITAFSASWEGVSPAEQVEILRDTWRRLWCCLLIADHDYSRGRDRSSSMFRSRVLPFKMGKPIPRNPSLSDLVCHWCGIKLTFDVKIHARKQRFRLPDRLRGEEALRALIASAKLVEVRDKFVVLHSINDSNF